MTPIIDIQDLAVQLLPPDKRLQKFEIMAQAVLSPTDRLNRIFQKYQYGDISVDWYDPLISYYKGNRTKTFFGVYESTIDGNAGNDPSDTTSSVWYKVLPCYIGANERSKYSSNKIMFEYALNRYFGTTFRDYTDAAYTPLSDIYITTYAVNYVSFVSYDTELLTSLSYSNASNGYSFDAEVYGVASTYLFTIFVPYAFLASLGSRPIANKKIRFFADKINMAGINYNIVYY